MPCGNKPMKKLWDCPKNLRSISASKYEQQQDRSSVEYWRKKVNELETTTLSNDKFWETTSDQVHELVGDVIFKRLRKIFNLPQSPIEYSMMEDVSPLSSGVFYQDGGIRREGIRSYYSDLTSTATLNKDEHEDESWSSYTEISSDINDDQQHLSKSKSLVKSQSFPLNSSVLYEKSKAKVKVPEKYSFKSFSSKSKSNKTISSSSHSRTPKSEDDLVVHVGDVPSRKQHQHHHRRRNPYYKMLYCNKSETDMIKWNSNYKVKKNVTCASSELNSRAENKAKTLAKEFFDWWNPIGSKNYKSDLNKPEDIEKLFTVWFDEHASQSLISQKKVFPCVMTRITRFIGATESSCEVMLDKHILWDIAAEARPSHTIAFGAALPDKLKHIPPKNNTEKEWHCVKIPEDLQSMACVWQDIENLSINEGLPEMATSTPKLSCTTCAAKGWKA